MQYRVRVSAPATIEGEIVVEAESFEEAEEIAVEAEFDDIEWFWEQAEVDGNNMEPVSSKKE